MPFVGGDGVADFPPDAAMQVSKYSDNPVRICVMNNRHERPVDIGMLAS